MNHPVVIFVLGVVAGSLIVGLIAWSRASDAALMEDRSVLGFAETVQTIQDRAVAAGWKLPKVHTISETVNEAGFDVLPVTVIELCKADLAGKVLSDEKGRRVSSMMPCRVAVYENAAGEVIVSRMNSGLMSRMFGGIVQEVMTEAADRNEALFAPVLGR